MPNIQAIKPSVPVALLYQTSQRGGHLKDALHELGAAIVYEALAGDFDREALEGSGARVVVFNLDADSDPQIDNVYDVLDEGNYEVVFNDDDASANLSGWDQARWARHLAAKILRKPEISAPPRPLGAESVPTPVQKSAAEVPIAERPGERLVDHVWLPLTPFETPVPVEPHMPEPLELNEPPALAPVEFEGTAASSKAPMEIQAPRVQDEPSVSSAPMEFEAALASSEAPTLRLPVLEEFASQPVPPADQDFPVADFGSALDEFLRQAPAESQGQDAAKDFAGELDALFADTRARTPSVSSVDPGVSETVEGGAADVAAGEIEWTSAKHAELHEEFPAIFDQLDMAAAAIPEATDGLFKPAAIAAKSDGESEAKARSTEPVARGENYLLPPEWLLETLDDSDSDSSLKKTDADAQGNAAFGIETIPAGEYLAPQVESGSVPPPAADSSVLELMPMEEAVAPQPYSNPNYESESWLDGSRPAQKLKVGTAAGVQRVFVLGASIGGPEGVRDFLGSLPAGFPVLFVLVQHMSEEFLELMSAQLAKSVVLNVRSPSHGERVAHGEIVVVPTTHRLQIDDEGVVTLAHLPERTAYSPSIDLVLRDVADQFGDKAGAIIFSGMAKDAIEGSKYLKSRGGVIWAQDPDTCAISTMVDGVRQAGVVSFIGSPQQLAAKIVADFGKK